MGPEKGEGLICSWFFKVLGEELKFIVLPNVPTYLKNSVKFRLYSSKTIYQLFSQLERLACLFLKNFFESMHVCKKTNNFCKFTLATTCYPSLFSFFPATITPVPAILLLAS